MLLLLALLFLLFALFGGIVIHPLLFLVIVLAIAVFAVDRRGSWY